MFTGIIKFRARIASTSKKEGMFAVTVQRPKLFPTRRGESIAVNGVCSTAVHASRATLTFAYMPETLRRTNLASLRPGVMVNLERPLTLRDAVSGHLVAGHVDAAGAIVSIAREGASRIFRIRMPNAYLPYIAPKGSVAVEGVALTVAKKLRDGFTVALIPYTLTHTNLGAKRPGDIVNIECDMLAKYAAEIVSLSGYAKKRA